MPIDGQSNTGIFMLLNLMTWTYCFRPVQMFVFSQILSLPFSFLIYCKKHSVCIWCVYSFGQVLSEDTSIDHLDPVTSSDPNGSMLFHKHILFLYEWHSSWNHIQCKLISDYMLLSLNSQLKTKKLYSYKCLDLQKHLQLSCFFFRFNLLINSDWNSQCM